MKVISVWDLPLRLFHWLLVVSVVAAYVSAKVGGAWIDWHGRIGLFIVGLLIFRIVWGFLGSTHARFLTFFPTFSRLVAYFKGQWYGIGHNPLGALSVLALLLLVATQVGSGLFANDDISFTGPLASLVDKDQSDQFTRWHNSSFNILFVLVILHVLAIVYHRLVKKNNLVGPMVTGKKKVPKALAEQVAPSINTAVGPVRLVLSLIISITVVWSVSGALSFTSTPTENVEQTAEIDAGF